MKRCRHRRLSRLQAIVMTVAGPRRKHITSVCVDCYAWLSLGPSNDEPEAVRIEIEAARIVAALVGKDLSVAKWKGFVFWAIAFGLSVAAADLALEILGLDGAGQ